jgi:Tfp pilus assembly protein PilN
MGLLEIIIAVGLNLFTGISMERSQMEAMVTDIEARKVSLEKESIEIIGYVNKRALKNTNILNLTVLKDLPPSILVKEVKLNAEGVSQLVLISRQPQAINAYIARLSKDPSLKTVKLESVELDATQVGRKDISVAKVSMVLQ